MIEIVVLAEEPSGKIIAQALSNSLGIGTRTLCIEHQGKSDLERSFPKKIGAWGSPTLPRFIVMRDNDGADCTQRKFALLKRVPQQRLHLVKIRLVMQELESWYLGDPEALVKAGLIDRRKADDFNGRAKYRNPDSIIHAKEEFTRNIEERGQIELARLIGPHLSPKSNRSGSFKTFVKALKWASNLTV